MKWTTKCLFKNTLALKHGLLLPKSNKIKVWKSQKSSYDALLNPYCLYSPLNLFLLINRKNIENKNWNKLLCFLLKCYPKVNINLWFLFIGICQRDYIKVQMITLTVITDTQIKTYRFLYFMCVSKLCLELFQVASRL